MDITRAKEERKKKESKISSFVKCIGDGRWKQDPFDRKNGKRRHLEKFDFPQSITKDAWAA